MPIFLAALFIAKFAMIAVLSVPRFYSHQLSTLFLISIDNISLNVDRSPLLKQKELSVISYQLKLIKMREELTYLNDCGVSFLSRAESRALGHSGRWGVVDSRA